MSDSINKAIRASQNNSKVTSHSQEEIYNLLELIEKYETLVQGNKDSYGLLNCLDPYYNSTFNNSLEEIKQLRESLDL